MIFDKEQTQELTLREPQPENIQHIRKLMAEKHRMIVFYASTGFGKTECCIYMMMLSAKKGKKSIFICDRRVLVNQTSERLDRYGISHGVIMAKHWRRDESQLIQICSAQTIEAMGTIPQADVYYVDEAHCIRKKIIEFMKNTKAYVIAPTASPFTKGLSSIYTAVAGCTTTKQLVDMGRLAPLRVFIAKKEVDMTGCKKVAGEWSSADASERGRKITGDVVATWTEKTHEIFGKPVKTIVFCADVAHGIDLAKRFQAAGYNFVSISYKDDDNEETIKRFIQPDSDIIGIIAVEILVKGFDCPDVLIGVDARQLSKSFSTHVQKLGRVMRTHHSKTDAVWIDHAGNYLRFQEKWDDLYENGVQALDDEAEKPMKEPTKKEKEAAKCPKCGQLWQTKGDTCTHCGFTRVRRNEVTELDGVVEELKGKKEKHDIPKARFYAELLGYAKQKGYNTGWAYHKTREKYGTALQSTKGVEPIPPSAEVLSWIRHQQIKSAKSRGL